MKRIFVSILLLMLLIAGAWAQPTPSTPPSPESLGLETPQPSEGAEAPPPSESGQALMATSEASAKSVAPTAMAVAPETKMVVPPGMSAPNLFYIPYYPSTVAGCNMGQWLPMWLDVRGSGPLYSYEWYPDGRLVSQQLAYVPYPSWQKMWFYGDAPGWHTLQYYCNGWSNYVYVYVYGWGPGPGPVPPKPGCTARIVVTSPWMTGFSVYVDGAYVGGDGRGGDPLNGYYSFDVAGNQAHTIKVVYSGGSYTQTKTYYCGNTYTLTIGSSSSPYPPVATQPLPPVAEQPVPPIATQPLPTPFPEPTPLLADQPAATPY